MATGGTRAAGEAVRHLAECPVCMDVYVDPKLLPCDHSLCAECSSRIKEGRKIRCPLCKAISDVSKVRPDFRLQQFIDALTETTANYSTFQAVSKSFCSMSSINKGKNYCFTPWVLMCMLVEIAKCIFDDDNF